MSESHRVGDLEIAENLAFVQRQWRLQRIGLRLMLLTVLLAFAGLFGSGPLSSAERQTPDGALTVGYHRFIRHDGNTTLTIEAHGRHAEDTEVEIWLSKAYLDRFQLQHISPQPTAVLAAGDRTIYVFALADPSAPLQVRFALGPQTVGRLPGEAGLAGGPPVAFAQISYP